MNAVKGEKMLFAIRFTDHPVKYNVRKQHLNPQLYWLKRNRDVVLAAGSLCEKHNDQPVGALWLVKAEHEEEALSIFSDDPLGSIACEHRLRSYRGALPLKTCLKINVRSSLMTALPNYLMDSSNVSIRHQKQGIPSLQVRGQKFE